MSAWDVFRNDRLEVERGLSTDAIREALAAGRLRDDDLVRPSGSSAPWTPIGDVPALAAPADRLFAQLSPPSSAALASTGPDRPLNGDDSALSMPVAEPDAPDFDEDPAPGPSHLRPAPEPPTLGAAGVDDEEDSALALPVEEEGADLPQGGLQSDVEIRMNYAPSTLIEDDDEDHEFHLGARGDEKVEELDLTAMVDIAMQLVMFFLVTSTTIFFKSLEIPTPSPEQAKAAQQSPKSLSQLEDTNILVEIDGRGQIQVDHEPITAEALVPKLRAARDATGRTAILLMADYNTLHKTAVRVIEAANEIGLQTQLGRVSGGPGAEGAPGG